MAYFQKGKSSFQGSLPACYVEGDFGDVRQAELMRMLLLLAVFSAIIFLLPAPVFAELRAQVATPPVAAKIFHQTTAAGYVRNDDYFWLRGKDKPDVQQYLKAEQVYTAAVMKPTEPLQRQLYSEMLSHIKQTDLGVPYKLGSYYYYSRTQAGKQYPIYARRRGSMHAPEQITLDLNVLAAGHKFLGLDSYVVSDDGNFLAYSLDYSGYRQYILFVKDLRTGTVMPERIERVDEVVWASDNKTLFYVTEDPVSKRNDKFFRHALRTTAYDLVYQEQDELYDIAVGRTRDRDDFIGFGKQVHNGSGLHPQRPAHRSVESYPAAVC